LRIKKLRKLVLSSVQQDLSEKELKAQFQKSLSTSKKVSVENGWAVIVESETKAPSKILTEDSNSDLKNDSVKETNSIPGENSVLPKKVANPNGTTRLFLGNLSWDIKEDSLKSELKAYGEVLHVKWITDKETKKFYGSAFIGMDSADSAGRVMGLDGSEIMGRPIKVNYAPPRPGDIWPPKPKKQFTQKPVSEKPFQGCKKLYCGNLSYDIDDDTFVDFFKDCGELQGVRWLTHKDTGEFRGCAFVEFCESSAADKAVLLNGNSLLGRPIRLDWDG